MDYDAIALDPDLDEAGPSPLFAAFVASMAMFALAMVALLIGAAADASASTSTLVSNHSMATNMQSLSSSMEFGSTAAAATFGALALGILAVLVVRGVYGRD